MSAGTGGIIHTGIGPFNIANNTYFWYLSGQYNRGPLNVRAYGNFLNATCSEGKTEDCGAKNLLNGLLFTFDTSTYDFSATNTSYFAEGQHLLTYGGNFRHQNFELNIAPGEDTRTEGGAFIEDSISLGDSVIINAGIRADGFSVLDDAVWSLRVGILVRPVAGQSHSIRASYSRAYRAPSLINNFLQTAIFNAINLGLIQPGLGTFFFPSFAVGNEFLVEEQLDQFELGFLGLFADDMISVDAAFYYSNTRDNIDFYAAQFYSPANPPPGWPLPPFVLALLPPLPSLFTYRNIGEIVNKGLEIGVQARPIARNETYVTYTYQAEPIPTGIGRLEINTPPTHQFSIGWNGFHRNFLYSASVSYVDEARWTDVLDIRFHGFTESHTTLNGSFGYLFLDGAGEVSVKGTNLTNEDFLQHVFGDIIGRRIVAEVAYTFSR